MDIISFDEFKRMDLKVAIVRKVEPHPNADKLYVLKIDVGGDEKTIVAGIRDFYKPEELENKRIVVINNLAPTMIRGIESKGMLLAAKDASTLAIITPDRSVEAGSAIS